MSYKKCEICGLKSKNEDGIKRTFMARYPLDPDRCKSWVKATGKEDLAYIPIEKLHQLKFLCKNHFHDCHFNKLKTRLKRDAVPSINLRAEPLSEEILAEFPCYLFKEHEQQEQGSFHLNSEFDITDKRHYDHNYCKPTVSHSTLLKDSKPLADNEDSWQMDNHLDADDDTTTAPREFSWQRPHEVIPCADDVGLKTALIAPDSAGGEGGDDGRRLESHNERLHSDCKCNECGSEIVGYRYTCVQCCDVDLCGACEASGAHPEHYVLRLPRPEPAGAVKGVLETMRGLLLNLPLHDRVKKEEEIDEEDPLSIGFLPPEPEFEPDFEFEELMEEESIEETTLPLENKFPLTDFTHEEDTFRHFPIDTARIQPPAYEHSTDIAHLDVEDCSSVLRKHIKLSEVIPILNNDSGVRCSVVKPCEEGTKKSEVRPGVATSLSNMARLGACVTRSGACARVSGAPARPPELVVKIGRLDNQVVYEALATAKRKGALVATVTHRHGQVIK